MGKLKYTSKLIREFWEFSMEYKIYWIVPLVLILVAVALLVFTSQAAAPFIYALF